MYVRHAHSQSVPCSFVPVYLSVLRVYVCLSVLANIIHCSVQIVQMDLVRHTIIPWQLQAGIPRWLITIDIAPRP